VKRNTVRNNLIGMQVSAVIARALHVLQRHRVYQRKRTQMCSMSLHM